MKTRKRINLKAGEAIIVDTPLGTVSITTGLTDYQGRAVDSVAVSESSLGNKKVVRRGLYNTRLVCLKGNK